MNYHDFKVSIIITSYNQKKYLVEAIESVLDQTFKPYEIIIADDASRDGSHEVIQEYINKYPEIVRSLIQKQNVGIPKNRNSALRMVNGNYVGILDGDDLFVNDKLEKQVAALINNPDASIVYSNFQNFRGNKIFLNKRWNHKQPDGNIFCYLAKRKPGLLRTLLADFGAVKEAGLLDERYAYHDGLWLTINLAKKYRFVYVDEIHVYKRKHEQSDSRIAPADDKLQELKMLYEEILRIMPQYADKAEQELIKSSWKRFFEKH